jgi:hypothetical protein
MPETHFFIYGRTVVYRCVFVRTRGSKTEKESHLSEERGVYSVNTRFERLARGGADKVREAYG